jgi:hypothetical protein
VEDKRNTVPNDEQDHAPDGNRSSEPVRATQRAMIKKALYDLETRERIFSDMEDAKESQKQHQEAYVKVIKDIVGDNKNRIKNFNQE